MSGESTDFWSHSGALTLWKDALLLVDIAFNY